MQLVVTSEEMRKCDNAATRDLGLSVELLMEHAGAGVVAALERRLGALAGRSAAIFCGKGKNGGDGLVAARLLALHGALVTVVLCTRHTELTPPAQRQADRFLRLLREGGYEGTCRLLEQPSARALSVLPRADVVVDAVFGTGFAGRATGMYARAIDWMNDAQGTTVAVDIPSGLDADTGEAAGRVVSADCTVTFQAMKRGLIIGRGSVYAGIVEVVDIGMPLEFLCRFASSARLIEPSDVVRALPVRPKTAHKHSVGKVVVIAGSVGFAGAAAMTAQSALRAGAGAVILCAPRSLYPILSRKLTEVMVMPVSESPEGALALDSLGEIEPHLAWADIVAIGPGLSRNAGTVRLVEKLTSLVPCKLLLDADGLNAFSGRPELLRKRRCAELVLTPHVGEFSRLTGTPSRAIEKDRLSRARNFAREYQLTLVLKGAPTLIAAPSGPLFLNTTGNPGMATAGSGDILTGLLAGLWAQGMGSAEASYAAVYLHGLAGDRAKARLGERSLLALDILEEFPGAFCAVERGGEPVV